MFIKQRGQVIQRVENGKARVEVNRFDACSLCRLKKSCIVEKKEFKAFVENRANANVGDIVDIVFPSLTFMKLTFLVYLVPAFMFLVFLIFFNEVFKSIYVNSPMIPPVLATIISSILTFSLWLLICFRYRNTIVLPKIVEENHEIKD